MTALAREEEALDRSQDHDKQAIADKKALRFVLGMGLMLLIAISICVLIWRFTSSRSYNALGQMIMIAGGILMLIGVLNLGNHSHTILRRYIGTNKEDNQMVTRGEDLRVNSRAETHVVLCFLGSGLLCLFIGYLIVIGL
jgi:tellurite resistance protein TehA-like permease